MTLKHHARLAAAHVPQSDALMITATGEHPTIGTKGHRPDIIPIALQGFQTVHTPPFLNFPELDQLVIAATGQHPAIGTKSDRPYGARVALERSQIICPVLSLLNSPQPTTLVIAAAGQ